MNRADREAAVRRLLERDGPAAVPPDTHPVAVRAGERLLRRRRCARRLLWLLLCAAAVAFTVWAAWVHPWTAPPPPATDW
ncbi:hypothetical protein KUM39_19115 [Streptomyces sp. J2-1]|uniref:hypothetical protein n=1 Tax=Streptomyces corallincola TaxID=2851888 RepID=UPI001C391634|nr:hypothetical protein [Streptomyces corallincola]MBV2356462.1 hypothetical protein [Streptomyces corallincola]